MRIQLYVYIFKFIQHSMISSPLSPPPWWPFRSQVWAPPRPLGMVNWYPLGSIPSTLWKHQMYIFKVLHFHIGIYRYVENESIIFSLCRFFQAGVTADSKMTKNLEEFPWKSRSQSKTLRASWKLGLEILVGGNTRVRSPMETLKLDLVFQKSW